MFPTLGGFRWISSSPLLEPQISRTPPSAPDVGRGWLSILHWHQGRSSTPGVVTQSHPFPPAYYTIPSAPDHFSLTVAACENVRRASGHTFAAKKCQEIPSWCILETDPSQYMFLLGRCFLKVLGTPARAVIPWEMVVETRTCSPDYQLAMAQNDATKSFLIKLMVNHPTLGLIILSANFCSL